MSGSILEESQKISLKHTLCEKLQGQISNSKSKISEAPQRRRTTGALVLPLKRTRHPLGSVPVNIGEVEHYATILTPTEKHWKNSFSGGF